MMKEYLGDGLYAEFDGYQIELYASDGINKTNVVYLDGGVVVALLAFIEKVKELAR